MRNLLFLLWLWMAPAFAGSRHFFTETGDLNRETAMSAYREGDFDALNPALIAFLEQGIDHISRPDLTLTYKLLGVMAAKDSLTRPKAESYFVQMLRLNSEIDIIDLYVSTDVHRFFKDVREREIQRIGYEKERDFVGEQRPEALVTSKSSIWFIAGTALVAGTIGAVIYTMQNKAEGTSTSDKSTELDFRGQQ